MRTSHCQTKIIEHTKIKLPFRDDMARATLEGRKNCTTRGSKKGSIGDQFDVVLDLKDGRFWQERDDDPDHPFPVHREGTFELFAVRDLPIWYVAKNLYYMEGFKREGHFIHAWDEMHEDKPFGSDLERMVVSHFYFPAGVYDYADEDMVKRYARKVA
jgi:hypothetical protein